MKRSSINEITKQVKFAVRERYAWPGGYPFIGITNDGAVLCADCMKAEFSQVIRSTRQGLRDGWGIDGVTILECGEVEWCGHCNRELGR